METIRPLRSMLFVPAHKLDWVRSALVDYAMMPLAEEVLRQAKRRGLVPP